MDMKKIEFTRFIERYLEGKMQSAEKRWFEAELEGNSALQKELELRRKVNRHVDNQDAIAFRQTLMNAEAAHRKRAAGKKKATRQIVNYAAIFAGLMLLGSLTLYLTGSSNNTQIASKYAPDFNPVTDSRSVESAMDEIYSNATDLYREGNYAEAIVLFNKIVARDMQAEYMKGASHMHIEQYKEAIGSFNEVVKDRDNLFIEDASFYLAVCYIQTEQENKALPILEAITGTGNRHSKEAKKILKKIK